MQNATKTSPRGRPWAMEATAMGGVLISAGIAGIGVAGIVGWASPLAMAGSAALIGGTLLTEVAASRLPVHAQARWIERARLKAAASVLGFLALTAWNVTAGHMGMVAINAAGVADARAPLERALAKADADRLAAQAAVEAFDKAADQSASLWADSLKTVDSRFVTAGTRRLEAAEEATARRNAERALLMGSVARAAAAQAEATKALQRAPAGRPDHELWGFALILELLKGALVWMATAGERKTARERSAAIVALAPKAAGEMTEDELRAMASRGASLQATARHELARRRRVA